MAMTSPISILSTSFLAMQVRGHEGQRSPSTVASSRLCSSPGARFHDFHHMNFNGNYASSFLWWDWLLGTDKQYREFLKSTQNGVEKTD